MYFTDVTIVLIFVNFYSVLLSSTAKKVDKTSNQVPLQRQSHNAKQGALINAAKTKLKCLEKK